MNTAKQIIANPRNITDGVTQHYRVIAMAKLEKNVRIKETGLKTRYKFADGSNITVNHLTGIMTSSGLDQFIQAKTDKQALVDGKKPNWTKALINYMKRK